MSYDYDLIVIGSGPAGEKGAAQAAYFGKRVAVIERDRAGGTCVHRGTLPSKALRESALCLAGLKTRGIEGVVTRPVRRVRVSELMAHRHRVSDEECNRVEHNLARHGADLIQGEACFVDPHTVRVQVSEGQPLQLSAEVILIATGSRPFRPSSIPFDGVEIYDADQILDLDEVPKTLLVIGAGVIGCEYASIFAALGVEVTLIEPRDELLSFLDEDVVEALCQSFRGLGIDLRLGCSAEQVQVLAPDRVQVELTGGEVVEAEKLLWAAGRTGNTTGLGLEHLGLEADVRGLLTVDEHYRTDCSSVYAAGDVIGFPALASTSMDQGRVAMCHAFDLDYKSGLAHHLPYGIYTVPACSMVGASERSLRARGEEFEVGRAALRETARGHLSGIQDGLIKLVFRREDKVLLGVHIVGEQASELIHTGMMVLQTGGSIDCFIEAVFNYPTLSEAYKYAAYDGLGRLAAHSSS